MTPRELEDRLVQACRTCASHNVGPVAAVSALSRAYYADEIERRDVLALLDAVEDRWERESGSLSDYRGEVVRDFLHVVRAGFENL